jgi:surface polysaccharide O-acyltransferase-like enzyme
MEDARRKGAVSAWALVAVDAALIFCVSAMPGDHVPGDLGIFRFIEIYQLDKIVHMLEYGIFGWLLTRALTKTRHFSSTAALALTVFVVGALYGASDEWHQSFVPMRDPNVYDWLADAVGVSAGIFVWLKKRKASPDARH